MPDASYRNNSDKSSQRAHVIFLAEDRKLPAKGAYRNSGYDKQTHRLRGSESATRGSIIDYESHNNNNNTVHDRCRIKRLNEVLWYVFVSESVMGRHKRRNCSYSQLSYNCSDHTPT